MKARTQDKGPLQITLTILTALLLIGGQRSSLHSEETNSVAVPLRADSATRQTNAVASNVKPPNTKNIALKRQLTGAELYSINCNRCHQERYPTERTAAQWKTIMLHMQVRANIPGQQARLILQYLQENSGR